MTTAKVRKTPSSCCKAGTSTFLPEEKCIGFKQVTRLLEIFNTVLQKCVPLLRVGCPGGSRWCRWSLLQGSFLVVVLWEIRPRSRWSMFQPLQTTNKQLVLDVLPTSLFAVAWPTQNLVRAIFFHRESLSGLGHHFFKQKTKRHA